MKILVLAVLCFAGQAFAGYPDCPGWREASQSYRQAKEKDRNTRKALRTTGVFNPRRQYDDAFDKLETAAGFGTRSQNYSAMDRYKDALREYDSAFENYMGILKKRQLAIKNRALAAQDKERKSKALSDLEDSCRKQGFKWTTGG